MKRLFFFFLVGTILLARFDLNRIYPARATLKYILFMKYPSFKFFQVGSHLTVTSLSLSLFLSLAYRWLPLRRKFGAALPFSSGGAGTVGRARDSRGALTLGASLAGTWGAAGRARVGRARASRGALGSSLALLVFAIIEIRERNNDTCTM